MYLPVPIKYPYKCTQVLLSSFKYQETKKQRNVKTQKNM